MQRIARDPGTPYSSIMSPVSLRLEMRKLIRVGQARARGKKGARIALTPRRPLCMIGARRATTARGGRNDEALEQ
jgi:hypothetical protein